MRKRGRNLVLLVAVLALLATTSNVLTLCVHEDDVGFQATWADDCCKTASCCKRSAPLDTECQTVSRHADGCLDYTLAQTLDWTPTSVQPAVAPAWAFAVQPTFVFGGCDDWAPLTAAPGRAPPPDPLLRTVILRC